MAAERGLEGAVVDFSTIAYFFLLPKDEASSLGEEGLAIASGSVVRMHITMSKMDQRGLGIDRCARYVCKRIKREPPTTAQDRPDWASLVCPYHPARRIFGEAHGSSGSSCVN